MRRAADDAKSSDGAEPSGVEVDLPEGVPVVYPQAARVLRRIVVGLAEAKRRADERSGTEEAS